MRRFLQSIIIVLLVCACTRVAAQSPQTVTNGQQTQAVIFPGAGCAYNWTNDEPGIGLAASGSGNIPVFTAINNGSTPIVAHIKATPVLTNYAYIANQGDGIITVIDVVSHKVIGTVGIGSSPVGMAASPDGKRIYAANNPINKVSVINTTDNSKVTDIPVGQYPYALAVSPDSRWVYAGNESDGSISVIDAQSNTVFATIHDIQAAISITVSTDGKWVYAATETSGVAQVYVINAMNNMVDSVIPIPYPQNEGMVITPDGKTLYMTSYQNSAVTVVNLVTKAVSTIDVNLRPDISPFASGPYGIAINSTGTRVYVICSYQNVIAVINPATNTVIKTIHVNGGEIFNVAVSNDDKELYVINRNANEVEVFNTANYTQIATITGASFNSPFSQGNFISKGPGCSGSAVNFTITVNPLVPTLTATTATGTISACAGSPSASPDIQQFTVSGTDLTTGIKATAPAGFEVSRGANSGYGSSVLLNQSGGKATNVVYVRSAASATGSISGNVVLTSAGADSQNITVNGIVDALPTVNNVPNQTKQPGEATDVVSFTGTANRFTWTNDKPGIGLAASGTGDIASFTAINTGNSPVIATIKVTPVPTSYAYIPNQGSNMVAVIDVVAHKVVKTIGVGSIPQGVAASANGRRVYITNDDVSTVSVISTADNTLVASIPVGNDPWGIAVSPDGNWVYVASSNAGSISVIETRTNSVFTTIPNLPNVVAVSVSPDGKWVYAVTQGSPNAVYIINASTNLVDSTIPLGVSHNYGMIITPDGKSLYFTNNQHGSVTRVDLATKTVSSIPVGSGPFGIAINSTGARAYVACSQVNEVDVINIATNTVIKTLPTSGSPYTVSVSSDDKELYVVNRTPNVIDVFSTANYSKITTITGPGFDNPMSLGNFISKGPGCTGQPVTFTITVNTAAPQLTTTAATGTISACIGSPSASPNIQQFTLSGSSLTSSVSVEAPPGFEVSLNPTNGYANALALNPAAGNLANTIIYVRSSQTASGIISDKINITSAGVAQVDVVVNGRINALPTVNTVANQTVTNGDATTAVSFTGTANTFLWTNDTPGIGLAASGSGDIAPFTAVNTGSSPVVATITATPRASGFAYIANSGAGNVSVINTETNLVVATLPVGTSPLGVTKGRDGTRVYVANGGSNNVSVINSIDNTIVTTVAVGTAPQCLVVSTDGNYVYVTNNISNTVSVISTGSNTVSGTIPVGINPASLCISPDGLHIYVVNNGDNTISVINTSSNEVETIINPGTVPMGIAINPDGSKIYITNYTQNTVSVISTATNAVISTINVGLNPWGISVSPDGSRVYVANTIDGTLSVINASNNIAITAVNAGAYPWGVSVSPDGRDVYVTNQFSNNVSVINTADNTLKSTVSVGTAPASIGDFITSGTVCSGLPTKFTITVNTAAPTITAINTPSAVTTTYGTASASAIFNISGTNMQAGILVTPPPGFEVSTDNINFSATTTVGTIGKIASTPVYIRLKSTSPVDDYAGNILLTSKNAPDINVIMAKSRVDPAALTITANNAAKTYGTVLTGSTGSTAFTATGLQNGEKVGSVTIAYGTGAAANAAAGTYAGSVTASAATGGTFTASNYTITFVRGNIIVSPATLTITANNAAKTYGTVLTGSTGSTAFTATGLQNGEKVGSVTIAYGAGAAATAAAGIYTGSVTASAATGGTFTASNYTITFVKGDIIVSTATLTITAKDVTKTYGTVLTGSTGSTAFTATGLQNGEKVGSVTIEYGTGATANAAAGTYTGSVTASAATGGTFTASNYTITFVRGNIIVSPATLTITANNAAKTYGTVLTGSTGSTAFTATGLQNGEKVGSVTIAYGTGAAATDPANTYTGSVVASAATGGTFIAGNYIVIYIKGNIIVNPAAALPMVTNSAVTGNITACAGSPSASPNIEQFTVSGTGLTSDITATAPGGFEVSLAAGSGFGSSVILRQSGGTVTNVTVYVRSAVSARGAVSGNVTLASQGIADAKVTVNGNVNELPVADKIADKVYTNGDAAGLIAFTGTGNIFTWINDNPAIGLPATGTGDLPAFTATNNTGNSIKATITVTPQPSGFAYITNASAGTVSVINITTNQVVKTIPVGEQPSAVALSPDNRHVYVVNNVSNTVSVIDVADNQVKATVSVGSGPTFAVVSPDGKYIYVTNEGQRISVIDAATNTVKNNLGSGSHPLQAAITTDGKILYITGEPDALWIVETATNKVNSITADSPRGLLMSPDSKVLYVANRNGISVTAMSTSTNSVIKVIPVVENPLSMAISSDGKTLYVVNSIDNGVLSVINTLTNAVTNVAVGRTPTGVSVTPDDKYIYVTNYGSDDVSIIDAATNKVISTIAVGDGPFSMGNFITRGTSCSGIPTTFTITVNALPPKITTGPVTGIITACAGSPSASPFIQQFTVSGSGLSGDITATASTAFEVSLSAKTGFAKSVTLSRVNGTVTDVVVYVRSAASAPAGPLTGKITLSSAGLADVTVGVGGVVNALPTVNQVPDQTKQDGEATAAVKFTGTGNKFRWTNDKPEIGLPVTGLGDIASFKAKNAGAGVVTATITVTPLRLGYAYIPDLRSNVVSVIDLASNLVVATVPVGNNPIGVAINAANNLVYVTNTGGSTVSVIDPATNSTKGEIIVDKSPYGIKPNADGSLLFVANLNGGTVSVINTTSNSVVHTIKGLSGPIDVAVSADGRTLYVSNNRSTTVSVISTADYTIQQTIAVGESPYGLCFSPDGSRLYVANQTSRDISVINTATNTVSNTIKGNFSPLYLGISPDGSLLYVPNVSSTTVSVVNTTTNAVAATLDGFGQPTGISFSPDGKYIYITNQSTNKLSVIDAATNTVVDNIPVAGDPVALGNFLTGAGCDGNPVTFTIKVNGLAPVLTHGDVTGSIIACAGSPSSSPNLQQFTVSGSSLPGDITAAAPLGFEVSLSANSGFGKSVTLTRTGGSVTNIIVYVRSADYAIGSVSGDVGLSCPGLPTQTVPVRAFVNALTTVNTVPDQTKQGGEATDAINFSGTGSQFRWTNDKPEIGLPASGTGNIASFIAVNNGNLPVIANITVTPISLGYAYIPNAKSNNVSIVDLANNSVISTPAVGKDPYGVAVNKSNSSVYITNSGGNTVSVINTVTNMVSGIITVGTSPYGIKLNADGSLLYVANFGSNEISIISTATNSVLKTIGGFTAPADVAISPDGSIIYVSNTNANIVSVIRTSDYSIIKTIPVGTAPYMMGISPDGGKVYVANDGSKDISVISTATNTVVALIDGNFSSYGVSLSPDGNFLYVPNLSSDNISIINTATNEIIAVIGGFRGPTGMSFSTDGRYYYVTNQLNNQLSIVNAQTNVILNNITVGNDPIAMGNFLLQGSACDGKPATFTITVNQALPATISTLGQLSPVNTIYGTPSLSSNFSVSGAVMREGIKVTPPAGIEVSTDNINFSSTLTVGAAGTIGTTTIYVRLAKTTPVDSYNGFITLESSGASTISVILPACVVSPAPLTVTANNKSKDYGTLLSGSSGSTDFTITGLKNSETAETVTVAYSNGAAADAPVGNYPGSAAPSALAGGTFDPKNYSPTYVNGDITINKVPLTITADNKSKSYKDLNPTLTLTYKGFVNNEGPAQLTTLPVMSTTADVTSLPGKYPISVSAATSLNYNIAFVNGILTISGINLPLKIPNTFTPNGDGINDTWAIVNIDEYPDCTVNIFNRYGQNVYSSVGYGKSWDGKYNGAVLPVSTYYYIIDLKNESKVYSGSITIIR